MTDTDLPSAPGFSLGLPSLGAVRARLTIHRLATVIVLGVALAFYMWTADTSIPFSFTSRDADVYNALTTGFLHGHTYLAVRPPAGLLHLRNPYDPAQNSAYANVYHDLSLFKGHFFSQWGPTPALTLFLPFRLTGLRMSESFAAALFVFIGLVCAVFLLRMLLKRLVPQTPSWLLPVATAGLALTNVAPFILRRPAQYEVAISSAYCFEMAGLLLVFSGALASPLRRWRLACGSLCLGLAVGARPTLALGGAAALAAAVYLIRRRHERRRILLWALGPFLFCGVLLATYNLVRFGSVTEFGQTYELASIDQAAYPFYKLAYVPPGLFSYLLVPARLALTFPHAFLMTATEYPFSLPHDYAGGPTLPAEPVGGVLTTMPITLLLACLPFLWRRWRATERPALLVVTGFAGMGFLIMTLVSWALFGTTQRYEVDFASLFLIAAFILWAILINRRPPGTRARTAIGVGGVALTAFGATVGTAVSFTGYYDTLRLIHPGIYKTLEDFTSPLATVATMVAGKAVIVRVSSGLVPVALLPPGYGTFGERGASGWLGTTPLTVTVVAPDAENAALTAAPVPSPGAPPKAQLGVVVSSPGERQVVPLLGEVVRMPIHLLRGINRITLRLSAPRHFALELALDDVELRR